MTEVAPTVTSQSAAICGSSELVERTMAWVAKEASASRVMARIGACARRSGHCGIPAKVDTSVGAAGLSSAPKRTKQNDDDR